MNRTVKRSRSLRAWYKYRMFAFLLLIVLVIIVGVMIGIFHSSGKKKEAETTTPETTTPVETTIPAPTEPETTTEAETTTEETTEATGLNYTRSPQSEEFTNADFYQGAVMVGDTFVDGLSAYGLLDDKMIIANSGWTVGKCETNAVDKIANSGATRVFLEIGLNDFNYETRTPESLYDNYQSLVHAIREKCPDIEIYAISVFPVSSGYSENTANDITNKEISEFNELLAGLEDVTFVNVNASIADSTGALPDEMTSNGYGIRPGYMAFIMNLIAEMCGEAN